MIMKRTTALTALGLVIPLLVTACGGTKATPTLPTATPQTETGPEGEEDQGVVRWEHELEAL